MLARIRAAAVLGIDAYPVEVEVDLANGLPSFATVGLPLGAVKEGRERVTAALLNSGFEFPLKRITANLAPADIPKSGSSFDLPIAVGILVASGQCRAEGIERGLLLGELGLEGALRPVRGALSLVSCARSVGAAWVIVPAANAAEGALVEGVAVFGADTLKAVTEHLAGHRRLPQARAAAVAGVEAAPDFREVRGQALAKRALEIAAAGGHNVLMVGPPGSGKTMLARRLPGILPPLEYAEAIEVTKIHSVAGLMPPGGAALASRPFRAPHHTVSDAGMSGGGPQPRPGEVSLAHHGVLFLDEFPEFRRNVLETLRQPVEDGFVTLSRAAHTVSYPARFVLAAAMNPCPCGHFGDETTTCVCAPERVRGYRARISGPLLDRIDLQVQVAAVPWGDLSGMAGGEPSEAIRRRVEAARAAQRARGTGNGRLAGAALDRWCAPDQAGRRFLAAAMERLALSARGYSRVLRVARTIADLGGQPAVTGAHVAEALRYRGGFATGPAGRPGAEAGSR